MNCFYLYPKSNGKQIILDRVINIFTAILLANSSLVRSSLCITSIPDALDNLHISSLNKPQVTEKISTKLIWYLFLQLLKCFSTVCALRRILIGCEYPHTVLIIGGSLHTYSLDLQFSNLVLFKCLTLQSYHKPLPTDHQHSIYTGNDVTNVFKYSQVWHLTPDFHLRGTSHHTKYYIGHGSVRKGVNHST